MPSYATTLLMWQRAASYPCCKLKETSYASLARICSCVLLSTVPPPLCRGHPQSGWSCNLAVTAAHDHQPTYSLLREAILYGSNSAAWVISTQLQRCPNQPSGRCDTRVFLSARDPTFGETFSYGPTNRRARMYVVPRRLATTSHPQSRNDCESTRGYHPGKCHGKFQALNVPYHMHQGLQIYKSRACPLHGKTDMRGYHGFMK
nr:hypothetical protein CFP56_75657 [Quercus suber]